jgi:hypothetical protein
LPTTNAAERDALAEYRQQNVPLYNDNKLKLGLFSMNCSGGMSVSTAPSSWTIDWSYHRQLVRTADALGFEIIVPVARWRGMGGETDYTGENYETFTYSSAVAASTENIMTDHPPARRRQGRCHDRPRLGWPLRVEPGDGMVHPGVRDVRDRTARPRAALPVRRRVDRRRPPALG